MSKNVRYMKGIREPALSEMREQKTPVDVTGAFES